MIDFLSELGSSLKWIYRGWFFMIFASYRKTVKIEHAMRGSKWRFFDFIGSCIFMALELLIVFQIMKSF